MSERLQPLAVCDGGSPAATEDDTNKLIAQTAKLAQLNSWFEIALNNMARGLSMFDAERRLIVCNAVYRELYELPEDLTRPGTHIADLVSYHALKEGGRNTPEEKETQRRSRTGRSEHTLIDECRYDTLCRTFRHSRRAVDFAARHLSAAIENGFEHSP